MNLKTSICGVELKNPLMPASGPLTGDYKKMKYLHDQGLGCMVTKTVSSVAAKVPRPCIYGEGNMLLNTELWSEFEPDLWIKEILPNIKKDIDTPLIVSAGYTAKDMEFLIPKLHKFADIFEISTHYVGKDLSSIAKTVRTIRQNTDKPILMKISPHIPEPVEFAKMVKENGGNGVVAINSLGPTMKLSLQERSVLIGNEQGQAWASGPAIKPVALALVNLIKSQVDDFAVIGVGGVRTADDVLEFMLAGADGVQLLSSALLYGKDIYKKILDDLPKALEKYGFESIEKVRNTELKKGELCFEPKVPIIDNDKCVRCKICEKACPYFAIEVNETVVVNKSECFGCSLCQTRCPKKAISGMF